MDARRTSLATGAIAALILGGSALLYQHWRAPRADSVILVTVDTLRADRLSSYGYRGSQTPAMDRIVNEGGRFAVAYCDIPWTTGSMASVMTGTYGPRHGLQSLWNRLPQDRLTLAEVLRSNGYTTGAVLASFPLDSAYGLDQGFDTYDDAFDTPFVGPSDQPAGMVDLVVRGNAGETDASIDRKMRNDAYRPDAEVTSVAVEWLRHHHNEHFFLWVHYFGPHEHIREIAGESPRKRIIDEYDSGVRESDEAIATLFAELGSLELLDRTLIVFHADHGQELDEHGNVGHGRNLYEEATRIPMAVRLPGDVRAGTVIDAVVRNIDIFPTVLDYLGIAAPADLDGRSLRPWLSDATMAAEPAYMELADGLSIVVQLPQVGEFLARTQARAVRDRQWKYLSTTLAPPCWRDAKGYRFDIFGLNVIGTEGATQVPDRDCGQYRREELYEVSASAYAVERDEKNLGGTRGEVLRHLSEFGDRVASQRGAGETLELEDQQKQKLKSLGYLQ